VVIEGHFEDWQRLVVDEAGEGHCR
jgi:hypothetical protein